MVRKPPPTRITSRPMRWNSPMAKRYAGCTRMTTANSPLSAARDGLNRDHVVGGALALLVQALFVLLVLLSPSHHTRLARLPPEAILLIPPLAVPAPTTIDARGPRRRRTPALIPVPPPLIAPPS